jgi:hypothetical protein
LKVGVGHFCVGRVRHYVYFNWIFLHISYNNLKHEIINILNNPAKLYEIGERSYNYVNKYHSFEYIGGVFKNILDKLGCLK